MSGKIIKLVPSKETHYCSGMPGLFRRIFSGIGDGSKWQCDECNNIWVFEIAWTVEWVGWVDTGKGEQK